MWANKGRFPLCDNQVQKWVFYACVTFFISNYIFICLILLGFIGISANLLDEEKSALSRELIIHALTELTWF